MKKLATLLALAFVGAVLMACGSDDSESNAPADSGDNGSAASIETTAGDGTLNFETDRNGTPAYTTTAASAPAGKVKIELVNTQSKPHNLAIEDANGKRIVQTYYLSEAADRIVPTLKPGEYTFYCSFQDHREAGMEGTLTVE